MPSPERLLPGKSWSVPAVIVPWLATLTSTRVSWIVPLVSAIVAPLSASIEESYVGVGEELRQVAQVDRAARLGGIELDAAAGVGW